MSDDFLKKWQSIGEEHIFVDQIKQDRFTLGTETKEILFISGMPSEFQDLNFDYLQEAKLQTVNEKYNLGDTNFDKYLAIGFNGSGDPISINQLNQELIFLNHDNEFEEHFINSDLKRFAESVIRIQEFLDQLTKLNPESFFETEFSDENYEALMVDLKRIDSKIFDSGKSHWIDTLENIKWEREEERNI